MVKILSYATTGELHVAIRGKVFHYFGVSPYWHDRFRKWIDHGRFGTVLKKLRAFSDVVRFEELGGTR